METLTREEIEMCEIAVGIITDTRTMTDDNMAKWDLLWDKLERMQKEAAAQQPPALDEDPECHCPAEHAYMTYVAHDVTCPARLLQ
jgi:hypothetical protein